MNSLESGVDKLAVEMKNSENDTERQYYTRLSEFSKRAVMEVAMLKETKKKLLSRLQKFLTALGEDSGDVDGVEILKQIGQFSKQFDDIKAESQRMTEIQQKIALRLKSHVVIDGPGAVDELFSAVKVGNFKLKGTSKKRAYAAVKIQAAFRGYKARKHFRILQEQQREREWQGVDFEFFGLRYGNHPRFVRRAPKQ